MKKFIYTVLTMAMVVAGLNIVMAEQYQKARVAGTSTIAGDYFYMVCDSTDTFEVDTVYSDEITVDTTKTIMIIGAYRDTVILATNGNDSIVTRYQVQTSYDGLYWHAKIIDSFDFDLARDSNEHHLYINPGIDAFSPDSVVWEKIRIETVFSDSFIQGEGYDTTMNRIKYFIIQR